MKQNVPDCALMLDVLAGYDGIDDLTPRTLAPGSFNFLQGVKGFLDLPKEASLKGKRIGVLKEAFFLKPKTRKSRNSSDLQQRASRLSALKWKSARSQCMVIQLFHLHGCAPLHLPEPDKACYLT